MAVDLEIEDSHIGEPLEQHSLPFHHGLAGERSDVAESKHRGPIAQHSNEISTAGVFERVLRILLDLQTRFGDARRIREAQVTLGSTWFCGRNFKFSRARPI